MRIDRVGRGNHCASEACEESFVCHIRISLSI